MNLQAKWYQWMNPTRFALFWFYIFVFRQFFLVDGPQLSFIFFAGELSFSFSLCYSSKSTQVPNTCLWGTSNLNWGIYVSLISYSRIFLEKTKATRWVDKQRDIDTCTLCTIDIYNLINIDQKGHWSSFVN